MKFVLGVVTVAGVALCLTPTGYSAQADSYDTSSLCSSATPSSSELGSTLWTIRSSTVAAIDSARGFSLRHRGPDDSLYAYDATLGQSRLDDLHRDGSTTHTITDRTTAKQLAGHLIADGSDEAAGLRVMHADQAWVAVAASPSALTPGAFVATGLDDTSALGALDGATAETGHSFTCSDVSGGLVVTDDQADGDDSISRSYTFVFTDAGAVSTLTSNWTSNGSTGEPVTDSFTYEPQSIFVPATVSKRHWERSLVEGSFLQVRTASTLTTRAQIATLKTRGQRVAAVRRIARTQARFYDTRHITVKNLRAGVRITAKEKWARAWSFAVTVTGRTVKVTTNLP